MRHPFAIVTMMMVLPAIALSQQQSTAYNPVIQLPDRFFTQVSQRSQDLQQKLERSTTRYLQKILKQEQKIRRKLAKKDSVVANQLFDNAGINDIQLNLAANQVTGNIPYIPLLDTLSTSLKFLQQHPQLVSTTKDTRDKIQAGISNIQALEGRLQQAETIKKALLQRQQYLQQQLQNMGVVRSLQKLNKQVYYYGQQVNEYKALLKQPAKLERKAIDLLSSSAFFQDFLRRNSRLAALFRLPGNDNIISYAGLQTRDQVSGMIQQQIASGGPNAQLQLQQQIQAAQAQLSKIKDKLLSSSPTGGGREEADELGMPDFKPNLQKTKTFRQRLEFGANFQSQKATNYFPVTSDIGLSVGYKLNNRSVIGIGASYKIGWGQGWNNIHVTRQGAGARSFIDWEIKSSYWLSGGFEYNYRPLIINGSLPPPPGGGQGEVGKVGQTWQQSGLIGLSKKYQISKKFKGNMQLLWDFLSYQQIPRSQPVVFRVGYDLK